MDTDVRHADGSLLKGEYNVDFAHTQHLTRREQLRIRQDAEEFLERIGRYAEDAYLKLDVQPHGATARGMQAFRWRALLVTNRGRFYADDWGFGAQESLKTVFDAIEIQIVSKVRR